MQDKEKTKEQLISELTECRRSESALREDKEYIQSALDTLKDVFFIFDSEGRFLMWNKAMNTITGYTDEEISSMKPTDFFAGEDISRVSHAIAEAEREGYATVEATATTKDRAEFPFEFIGSRLKKSEGKIYIGGIGRDITERKRAEETLRKSHDELEKRVAERTIELSTLNNQLESEIEMRKGIQDVLERSEESYRKLVSAITAYTFSVEMIDGNPVTAYRSLGCVAITGYKPEEYLSNPNLWYEMIHPDDRARVQSAINDILSGQEVPPVEHRLIRRDGEVIWVRNTMVPFFDTNRRLLKYDGMIEDVTKRKHTEEHIRLLNKELEQKILQLTEINKALDCFNRSVSHDLQAPLTVIGGFARRLLKVYGDTFETEAIDLISTIQMNAQKMERLIKDLLAFSRSAQKEIKIDKIDMTTLVKTIIDELTPALQERSVRFDIRALSPAYGDRGLIKQVIENFLSNAIKFTSTMDKAIIEVGCRVEEHQNVYYVKDNGIGFDCQYAEKLFTPFTRLPEAEEFDGTGIGLSIVERIINRHSGRVWAEGKVGEGATFYFSLPKKYCEILHLP